VTTALLEDKTRQELWTGAVIDCDVHANIPSLDALFPYMDAVWVQWMRERGWLGPAGNSVVYPPGAPSTARREWRPEGKPPASELALLREHILDPWQVEYAVVNCYYAVDSLRHPDWAAALAAAVNDYLIDNYLDKDPRLVGSLVLPARDPAAMIAEINRVGDHPGFVQAMFPVRNDRLWGQRIWHPVYEALVEKDLVMGLHFGGTTEDAPSPTGFASWYVEEYAAEWQSFAAQVTSLIAEGVFQAFTQMRVAVLEGGFTWLPIWGWRMNKEWKALRREVPWVDRPPLDILRDHMRFSIAPIDAGPPEQMAKVVDWLGSEDILMFATDYPHMHDDDIGEFLSILPDSTRPKVMSETARAWYRLP
jgi:predicted TIM-barrel fold metal-dependent hydrolase